VSAGRKRYAPTSIIIVQSLRSLFGLRHRASFNCVLKKEPKTTQFQQQPLAVNHASIKGLTTEHTPKAKRESRSSFQHFRQEEPGNMQQARTQQQHGKRAAQAHSNGRQAGW
jgi:hypothetical protein